MVGKGKEAEQHSGAFDDLMLKEWALKNTLSRESGGGGGFFMQPFPTVNLTGSQVGLQTGRTRVGVGSLVRASSISRSPFLLDSQGLHKSVVLVIEEDDKMTLGLLLNRPTTRGVEIGRKEKITGQSRVETVPIIRGGEYVLKGNPTILWLHYNEKLKAAGVGREIGAKKSGIWQCTTESVTAAIEKSLASPEDFLAVEGVSVWTKTNGIPMGMQGEVNIGNFELVPQSKTNALWASLLKQQVLSPENISRAIAHANEAWEESGESVDEKRDELVFKSDVRVSELSETALKHWVAAYLLGMPKAFSGQTSKAVSGET
eukprot:CAMPEP_0116822904 /NCGR_PEP_ID=MMETSP0418-20121206/536_1 /TAXON_ID=1158023 /ORGANISM="Astrosyne radiata, Strain 13vi08-1A" /LENGTH=316 /DNA_ID=CAMNT_0004451087 /DNA_START=289 /DNA_END=1239 /DNA_ORIENTATION=-